jgi:hypothetical protein
VNRGAVAIIDALGFKGIWGASSSPSTAVLKSLKQIGEAARLDVTQAALRLDRRSLPNEVAKVLKDPFIKLVQLSDTIVVAAGRRPRQRGPWQRHATEWQEKFGLTPAKFEDAVDAYLRFLVCKCVCSILKTAALCETPLLYRGVVTVGSFAIDETFLLGPAVDEAAELMDIADGPFVWLSPAANRLKHVIQEMPNDPWPEMVIQYKVPLKGGRRLPTRVLNPFFFCSPEERIAAEKNAMKRMDSSVVDVAVKRGNTRDLIAALDRRESLQKLKAKYRSKK